MYITHHLISKWQLFLFLIVSVRVVIAGPVLLAVLPLFCHDYSNTSGVNGKVQSNSDLAPYITLLL